MREFAGFADFAAHLVAIEAGVVHELHHAVEQVGAKVEKTAKAEIGHYQQAVGPFPAWPELAEATQESRAQQGFTPNDPLLRSGEMRDTISHTSHGLTATIGSTSDIAAYQELGTAQIPPRPFLGPAVIHCEHDIKKIVGAATVRGLIGGSAILPALGYDREV